MSWQAVAQGIGIVAEADTADQAAQIAEMKGYRRDQFTLRFVQGSNKILST